MAKAPKYDEKDRKQLQAIKQRVDEMQALAESLCSRLNMTAAARSTAEKVYRKIICGKQMLFFDRHSEEERRFLRLMLKLAFATEPELLKRAEEVAKYYSRNYGFEWVQSEITAPARDEARAMILSVGESSFGEAGTAAALAYVRCHHKTLKHFAVGDFGKTYGFASRCASAGDFNNKDDERRKALGLDKLRTRREMLLEPQQQSTTA